MTSQSLAAAIATHTHVQELDGGTLIMVTAPRGAKSAQVKEIAKAWFAKKGTPVPTKWRTVGYRNWYTPFELKRVVLEVGWN